VVVKLNNENLKLKSGMFGKVEIVFDEHHDSLILAQSAIITQDNRSHVFVVKKGKAIQTPITLGFAHQGRVEILQGLVDDDLIITTGQQILKHETKVEVLKDELSVSDDKSTVANHAKK
jgi:membrane fusion protein (multidrug efflux system)